MSAPIEPGSRWLDRSSTRGHGGLCRVVEVADAKRYGYVTAYGWWQELRPDGVWVPVTARRRTRINVHLFRSRYELLPDQPDPSAVGGEPSGDSSKGSSASGSPVGGKPMAPSEGSSDLQVVLREDGESR